VVAALIEKAKVQLPDIQVEEIDLAAIDVRTTKP
jgi:hypothetical protein